MSDTVLRDLYQVVLGRKAERQEGSYTCYLFDQGLDKILKKVGEESAETIIAAKNGVQERTVEEISDLLYHLMVLMAAQDIPLEAVLAELDLKKAAKAAGVKSVAMIHVADINKVTGYVRGGCSPLGMKKQYVTVFDESCLAQPAMLVSGGRIGTQIECAPADLIRAVRGKTAAITQEHGA